ncbi:reverse transcriptase domain-containing protein [Tanacetum coccineum]|uniref:Reverse transcriptase domain-containing protein n=1 Tax=Tanacetum coccineum TaxID=301880 RepID=A0ABQ5IGS1_9ASTR
MNTAVTHPQANGLVERANQSLMEGIKTRLRREKAGWVNELLDVLWAHQTSVKQSNEETPFSLTYDSEAERRETTAIREARYKTKMEQVEDQGKLGPKWEGPYSVMEAYENGSYKLQTLEDK